MHFHQIENIRYLTFDLLQEAGITHGVLTRRGGVSPLPWSALNVGATVGDAVERVQENRRRSFEALNRPLASMFDVWQVHSADVVCADVPRPSHQPHQRADAILTDKPDVTLFMRFADCTPVLLYDPVRRVIGLVHAGWLGTVRGAVTAAVNTMQARYGVRPQNVLAGIGPSIAAHHYEVGPEVVAQVQQAFGPDASSLLQPSPQTKENDDGEARARFDLWEANRLQLERCGVRQVEVSGVCTACNLDDWYSHRAESGHTGRFGALIAI